MNFCFWPKEGLEYEFLASSVKQALLNGSILIDSLSKMTSEVLATKVFGGIDIPLLEERARILREVGMVVQHRFNSSFTRIVESADKSVVKLVEVLTSNFPNLQDHTIFKGRQVHFYRRAQILIRDIWAHFQGKGIG